MKPLLFGIITLTLALSACGRLRKDEGSSVDYNAEAANAAGEQLAGMDEATTGSGITMLEPRGTPSEYAPWKNDLLNLVSLPSAWAANCTLASSWMCTTTVPAGFPTGINSALVGDFSGGCTSGGLTVTGKTNIGFSTSSCHIPAANDYLIRKPDITFMKNGYTLKVAATSGGGQKLTRTGTAAFDYEVLGVERAATNADGGTLFDIETTTGSAIHVTGLTRAGRTMNGGSLVVQHKLAGFTSTLVPNNLTWSSGCNCPTSGSLDATNSGSRTNSWTLTMTGTCGEATLSGHEADGGTLDAMSSLDHCHSI